MKKIEINGKLYSAEKVGSYTPPKEKPVRVQDEYVLPRHTSLFVKTLETTIESNLQDYFTNLLEKVNTLKKEAFEAVLSGNQTLFQTKFKQADILQKEINSFEVRAKLIWMSRILLKYDELTSQIAGRLH